MFIINNLENRHLDKIATGRRTKEIIEKYDFVFKKKFGQNFLIDTHVINKIINSAELNKDDLVIEIGPGIGSLTEEIVEQCGKLIAIEIDNNLIPILTEMFGDYENFELINEDVLKIDFNKLLEENSQYKRVKVVANLPYYITTPIIMNFLEKDIKVDDIIVMIQKEVAYRMNAVPSSKEYGSLSLVVQYLCDTYLVANVPQNCFMPRPNVDSAVIKLSRLEKPRVDVENPQKLVELFKIAFSQRRKTLVNCIFNSGRFNYTKEELENKLDSIGINPKARGESLNIDEYAKILEIL